PATCPPFPTRRASDLNRHREGHDDGPAVAEEDLKVLSDHRYDRCEGHQSRRLLPVRLRNTDSSEPPRVMPASVSDAMTCPRSMIDRKSTRLNSSHSRI